MTFDLSSHINLNFFGPENEDAFTSEQLDKVCEKLNDDFNYIVNYGYGQRWYFEIEAYLEYGVASLGSVAEQAKEALEEAVSEVLNA